MPNCTARPGGTNLSGQPLPTLLQGKGGVEDKPAHISQGGQSFCCQLQLTTPTKTAEPFNSFVSLLWENAWTSDLLIHKSHFRIQHFDFMYFLHPGDTGFLAAAGTHAKAIAPAWCLQRYVRTSQCELHLPSFLWKLTPGSRIPSSNAGCCIRIRGAAERIFFHT